MIPRLGFENPNPSEVGNMQKGLADRTGRESAKRSKMHLERALNSLDYLSAEDAQTLLEELEKRVDTAHRT